MTLYPIEGIKTSSVISEQEAITIAQKSIQSDSLILKEEPRLVILPIKGENTYSYKHAWKIKATSLKPLKSQVLFICTESGKILSTIDEMRDGAIYGNATGTYWPQHHYDNTVTIPFQLTNIRLYDELGNLLGVRTADQNGYYSFNNLSPSVYILHMYLENNYVKLYDHSDKRMYLDVKILPQQVSHNWGPKDYSSAYYHVTKAHNYFKNTLNVTEMDYKMPCYVEQGANVNGSATGTMILFGSQDGKYWARSSDCVYHEYTHNVVYHLYGSAFIGGNNYYTQGYAMDEGFSDYFACTINNHSIQGESVLSAPRNLDNTLTWDPEDGGHKNGRVIGGACWDIREACGNVVADNLVIKALDISPQAYNFEEFANNVKKADYLYYNSSNKTQIIAAFANHGIEVPRPKVPVNLSVSVNYGTATLSWNAPNDPTITKYNIYRKTTNGEVPTNYSLVATVNSNVTSWTDADMYYSGGGSRKAFYCITAEDSYKYESNKTNYVWLAYSNDLQKKSGTGSDGELVTEYNLSSNYPNPFNPSTNISYSIPVKGNVLIKIYNSVGEEIAEPVNEIKSPGRYTVKFDGTDLPSGLYLYSIRVNDFSAVKKMLLIK